MFLIYTKMKLNNQFLQNHLFYFFRSFFLILSVYLFINLKKWSINSKKADFE